MVLASNHLWKPGPDPDDIQTDSPYCALHRSAGYLEYKSQAIAGFAGVQNFNLFQVTGDVELRGLWGVFTAVTEVTTLNAANWNLYDGTATVQLTAAGGTALGGASLGSAIAKEALAATALTFNNASQCRYSESAFNRVFVGGLITQKVATNTYVRFSVTTDANTNCTILFWISWVCRYAGSSVVAV